MYNLAEDMVEQNDLAESNPDKLKEMLVLWDAYVAEKGVFVVPDSKMRFSNTKTHYN